MGVEFAYKTSTKKELETLKKCHDESHLKEIECLTPNCKNIVKTKSNHLLQANGILNKIANNQGDVWFFQATFFLGLQFEKKHINSAYKFKALCNDNCDDVLFASIEKKKPNFDDNNAHYLFSYRAFLNEKQKIIRSLYEIELAMQEKLSLDAMKFQTEKEELFQLKLKLHLEYENMYLKADNFRSKYRIINNLDIALSTSVSLCVEDIFGKKISHFYFIHVLPLGEDKACLSISTDVDNANFPNTAHLETYIPYLLYELLNKLNEAQIKKFISDILLRYAEDWVVSDDFYKSNILPRKEKINIELMQGLSLEYKYSEYWDDPNFNLFDTTT